MSTDSDYLKSGNFYADSIIDMPNGLLNITNANVFATIPPDWIATHAYPQNFVMHPAFALNPGNIAYQATTPGTSGSSEPTWTTCQTVGSTCSDGSVVWTALANGNATIPVWSPNYAFPLDFVLLPGPEGNPAGYYYTVTTAGLTGGLVPTWTTCVTPGCTLTDGTIVWTGEPTGTATTFGTFGTVRTVYNVGCSGCLNERYTDLVGGVANLYSGYTYKQSFFGNTSQLTLFRQPISISTLDGFHFTPFDPTQNTIITLDSGHNGTRNQSCYQFTDYSGGAGLASGEMCMTAAGHFEYFDAYPNFNTRIAFFNGGGNKYNVPTGGSHTFDVNDVPALTVSASSSTLNTGNWYIASLAGSGNKPLGVNNYGQLGFYYRHQPSLQCWYRHERRDRNRGLCDTVWIQCFYSRQLPVGNRGSAPEVHGQPSDGKRHLPR